MKVVFVDVSNKEKISFKELKLNDSNTVYELIIPTTFLNKRVFEYSKGILNKVKAKVMDNKLYRIIKSKEKENIYVLSKSLNRAGKGSAYERIKQYIINMFETAGYMWYMYEGNIKAHLFEYIEEQISQKKMKNVSLLMIYNEAKNVDIGVLEKLIERYKIVDIYCKRVDDKLNTKVQNINDTYGSSISINTNIKRYKA